MAHYQTVSGHHITHPHCCVFLVATNGPLARVVPRPLPVDQYLPRNVKGHKVAQFTPHISLPLLTHSSYLAANYRYMPGLAIIFITDYIPANRV